MDSQQFARLQLLDQLISAVMSHSQDLIVIREGAARGGLINDLVSSPKIHGLTFLRRNGGTLSDTILADLWSRQLRQASQRSAAGTVVLVIGSADELAEPTLSCLLRLLGATTEEVGRPRLLLIGTNKLLERFWSYGEDALNLSWCTITAKGLEEGLSQPKVVHHGADTAAQSEVSKAKLAAESVVTIAPAAIRVGFEEQPFTEFTGDALAQIPAQLLTSEIQVAVRSPLQPEPKPRLRLARASIIIGAAISIGLLGAAAGTILLLQTRAKAPIADRAEDASSVVISLRLPVTTVKQRPMPTTIADLDVGSLRSTVELAPAILLLIAQPGDTLPQLYARVYQGLDGPPYADVSGANRLPLVPGALVKFPRPPGGWMASTDAGRGSLR